MFRLKSRSIGLGFIAVRLGASVAFAQTPAITDPVGFHVLSIRGASDNVLSVPMERLPIFAGTVQSATATTLTVAAGHLPSGAPVSPAWSADQFVFNAAAGQQQTFLVEFASGQLKGVRYRITGNGANTLTLDTQGDDLTAHPPLGAVVATDSLRIRAYIRIRDVFEVNGVPVIEARPNAFTPRDDILIPSSVSIGVNKAPSLTIFFLEGQGWRAAGEGATDFSDYPLEPNEGLILRRRNPANLSIMSAGAASVIRAVSFVPGGDGTSQNDTYISLLHPVPVTLDQSGLRSVDQTNSVIKDSTSDFARQDELLAFDPDATGFNVAPSITYYYRAGQGWKQVGNNLIVGSTVTLQPATAYIVRKKAQNPGVDWVKDPNF
jgi:uncharacterized protein (TIGR02597 family)